MTEKLFEKQPKLDSCTAVVLSCTPAAGGFEVVLDRTVLFPEGGGQLCDRGTVDGECVLHVGEQGDTVYHLVEAPVEAGKEIQVCLDRQHRLDNSQQHTGEHIISFSFWKLFGAKNVGFHMNEEVITIDLDMEFTQEQITAAEDYANMEIWQDKPVDIVYRMDNDLEDIPMRKTTEKVKGMLRVVVIPGGDACTCCGTHVETTGQVGVIKILKAERHRGGMRLECACGRRALEALRRSHDITSELMTLLSTGQDNIIPSVENLKEELRSTSYQLHRTSAKLMDYVSAEALEQAVEKDGVKVACVAAEITASEAKQLLTRLLDGEKRLAAVLYPTGDRLGYITGRTDDVSLSCREVSALINALFNGKGGGRDQLCQGAGKLTKDWKELVTTLCDSVVRMI